MAYTEAQVSGTGFCLWFFRVCWHEDALLLSVELSVATAGVPEGGQKAGELNQAAPDCARLGVVRRERGGGN